MGGFAGKSRSVAKGPGQGRWWSGKARFLQGLVKGQEQSPVRYHLPLDTNTCTPLHTHTLTRAHTPAHQSTQEEGHVHPKQATFT